ncbi:hypothetical protein PPYR_14472 [Photinus pyralis]|uniref:G-protein coupled receptors family 2 profile 2 domain-containing protein n=1 Tax=Photinus pyralis TaxID=7054 RepID=A0A5N4A5B6_PHOPY|nr:G-protein coupled receptor Mth2-like isoform X3 [Photinus pyralis]KAB0792513.1 hypothetical protein PPYR_14472 [Photinus pyralis]
MCHVKYASAFSLLLLQIKVCAASLPCDLEFGTSIENGVLQEDNSIINDGIKYTLNNYQRSGNITIGCICNIKSCARKCCDVGKFLQNKTCVPTTRAFFIPNSRSNYDVDHYHFVYGSKCKPAQLKLLLDPRNNSDFNEQFLLTKSGELFVPSSNVHYSPSEYCIDYIEEEDEIQALICENDTSKGYKHSAKGMIISMPFLLLTFLVYAVLPDRNLHGKCLMCYVITLFGAYAFLVFIQLYPNDLAGANCKTLGILCFFFFTVSFFWMNVMSIDIWWAFSGLRGFSGSRKEAERKRFILYCGYAWGVSLLLTTIVIGFTVSENVEKNVWYNPGMGDGQCWFRDGVPTLLYFYVPMATIIVVNITLFAVTACKIKRVQQDTAMLRKDESKKHSYENDKQRFNLYLKLMLAMGVNWAMEIVSWIVDWQIGRVPPPVWYLTDFCNALYGVFVFFIFVFKRNIWKLLKRRYYMIMGKPHLARSMTQTAYSPRTTGSSLNHTVSTDKNFVTDSSVLTSEVS